MLAEGNPGLLDWIAPALAHVDELLPNREQVLAFTPDSDDLVAGCRALLERGARRVAVTCGADGVVIVDADGVAEVPAFAIDPVDTTGCGDEPRTPGLKVRSSTTELRARQLRTVARF